MKNNMIQSKKCSGQDLEHDLQNRFVFNIKTFIETFYNIINMRF